MPRLFALFLLALLPSCLMAAEPAPNTLTGDEIAKGWILLFDGSSTFGWHAPDGSEWKVKDGALAAPKDKEGVLVTTTAFLDYDLDLEYVDQKDSSAELRIACDARGTHGDRDFSGRRYKGPTFTPISRILIQVRRGATKTALPHGKMIVTYLELRDKEQTGDLAHGYIALVGKNFSVRSVKLRPRGMESIFNGKDLTGWKEHPGKKSKFTVSAEGLLNVQNGPGDLQAEKQWADFVLQLQCYSNGKHLNSGIFFRCLPGQYQQGYEAQVRNQFTKEPTQEYTVEEYDPQTHRLTGTKKVRSPAVDYGTGAIYRRQPARSQVSRDREWFTLTVVAEGRHLATWVNGIQQTDWTDQRPECDNARNGCRLEKGCISIQGHDPTTDLSFRNLRIAEMPAPRKD
jgi:hypothetical protein